ncbi:hypothetical protein CCR75_002292 [Bremia lactucae]|uniref:Uncharacterized protein n=1 Tax=Bremia lactucae TaxID=4779 RepID=A0A976FK60_BRELC|nr:hypothetical protein CCR75_002292 [Bremia lactucae]
MEARQSVQDAVVERILASSAIVAGCEAITTIRATINTRGPLRSKSQLQVNASAKVSEMFRPRSHHLRTPASTKKFTCVSNIFKDPKGGRYSGADIAIGGIYDTNIRMCGNLQLRSIRNPNAGTMPSILSVNETMRKTHLDKPPDGGPDGVHLLISAASGTQGLRGVAAEVLRHARYSWQGRNF